MYMSRSFVVSAVLTHQLLFLFHVSVSLCALVARVLPFRLVCLLSSYSPPTV